LLALAACEREQRRFQSQPAAASGAGPSQMGSLHVGPAASAASASYSIAPAPSAPESTLALRPASANPYEENAYAVAQGKRLFRWYHCSGCHAGGGGSIGPALMDDQWIYGAEAAQVVASILQGRPNGMPSFAGRIPEDQAWQIAAYVRSMSGQLRTDVAPSRADALSAGPPEARRDKEKPKGVAP
ncbi:MAG TPA: c-type cytochrome, partial [Albitalea sp.]|uniref:c-type cytochrome n=1 Tax=Piscinibacter sp. TaxID=1903157 RepID=UPI002ED12541